MFELLIRQRTVASDPRAVEPGDAEGQALRPAQANPYRTAVTLQAMHILSIFEPVPHRCDEPTKATEKRPAGLMIADLQRILEVAAHGLCVRVVRAEHPFVVGDGGFEQWDRLAQLPHRPVRGG